MRSEIEHAVTESFEGALSSLKRFLSIPSVSTQNRGMDEAVSYLCEVLRSLGAEAKVVPTDGFPAVIGSFEPLGDTAGQPTLLLYGHYDVQPEDPIGLWTSPPFEPSIRDGVLYARGATDDKGNIMAALWGIAVARRIGAAIPRVTFCLEGEEEIGSPHLPQILERYRSELAADACILCDRGIHESGAAQIYLGNKGMVSVRLRASGPARDVHSSQAPLIPNPARQLMEVIARISTEAGRVAIDELLTQARRPDKDETALLEALPFDGAAYARGYGLPQGALLLQGEVLETFEQLLFRPTANVQGFHSGYGGSGNKTIIPSTAEAKMDIRLSPGMDKQRTADAVRAVLARASVEVGRGQGDWLTIDVSGDMDPYVAPVSHPAVQAALRAGAAVYPGRPVVWPLVDGSGPLKSFADCIGGPAFLIGLGNPFATANTHAPDENLDLETYRRGIAMMAQFLLEYGDIREGVRR